MSGIPNRSAFGAACSIGFHVVAAAVIAFAFLHERTVPRQAMIPPPRVVWIAAPRLPRLAAAPAGAGSVTPRAAARPKAAPATPPMPAPVTAPPSLPDTSSVSTANDAPAADSSPAVASTAPAGDGAGSNGNETSSGGDGSPGGSQEAFRPGNGVTLPVVLRQVRGTYTPEAMHARAHGVIDVECVVEPNGRCDNLRIVRSLQPPFGLDQQALAAARQWQFKPGTRAGQPVPVLVTLEIEFIVR